MRRRLFTIIVIAKLMLVGSNLVFAQEDLLQRGTYLMESIVACGNCHTPKTTDAVPIKDMQLAGGFVIEEPVLKAFAPNITPDRETGIGSWSDEEIIRSIRDGIRQDGSVIGPPMPSFLYRDMSDRDVRAIVAYLRKVKPVKNVVPKSEYRVPLPPDWGPPVIKVPEVSKDDPLAYGTYVAVALGHCIECHTPIVEGKHDFSRIGEGGNLYDGIFSLKTVTVSANITPHPTLGIGSWTDEQIKKAITDGVRPDGRKLAPAMAFHYYNKISDSDLDAMVLYLRSLKPLPVGDK